MTKPRCQITMSLDGYVAGPNPGNGARLLDNLDAQKVKLEPVRTIAGQELRISSIAS